LPPSSEFEYELDPDELELDELELDEDDELPPLLAAKPI
jgi:hypothetical protein